AGRLHDEIHARLLGQRPARAEGGDGAVDETRVVGVQRIPAEPVPIHHPGTEVLQQHVRAPDEPPDQRHATFLTDVAGEPALVAVETLEVEATNLRGQATGAIGIANAVAAPRLLDLHHVGAHVAEQRAAPRARRLVAQVDDANARERAFPSVVHAV